MNPQALASLVSQLCYQNAWVVTVESCTGGRIASALTSVGGSSEIFWGSFVTYANSAKVQLGVLEALLQAHGAVSFEVASALAESGLARLQAVSSPQGRTLYSVSATGIAGPSGGFVQKPVGLCYLGLACVGHPIIIQKVELPAGTESDVRRWNQEEFTNRVLALLQSTLQRSPSPFG